MHIIGIHMKNITSDIYFSRIHIKKKKKVESYLSSMSWVIHYTEDLSYLNTLS
mgnify:CR=1 FL=1